MRHHVIFWRLARREADVGEDELAALLHDEERGEVYIEFLDGTRRPHTWDAARHRWIPSQTTTPAAA